MAGPSWTAGLMMPEKQALKLREPEISAEHTVRGMFMTSTLECIRRVKGDEAMVKAAADAGFAGVSWGIMKKIPLAEFNHLRGVVAQALLPEVATIEEAISLIGGTAVDIFFESVAGRTMKLLAGKDPHRLMSAAPNGYVLAVEDGAHRTYEKVGESAGLFTFVGDRLGPCHQFGVFSTAIKTVCGVTIDVQVGQNKLLDFEFRASW